VSYRLGVDLGTTYTAAAVNVDDRVEMLGLGIRAMQVPSVVFLRNDGTVVVGEAAEQEGAADPARLVREFKRRVGDSVPLVVGGSPFSAQALTARLLAWVVGVATERQGGPPEHVCVTYPANWGPFKRDLLGQAIEMAGLRGTPTSTRTEPEAAAIAYASRDRVAEGDRIAVYDLGGGTFDAAVLVREAEGFRLAGPPEGIEQLGGIDFDEAVFRHVLSALGDEVAQLDDMNPATVTALSRLRRDCVDAKEVLSFSVETVVPVALPGITQAVRLTRGELDDMLRPAVGETVAAMRRVLGSAGVEPGDLAAIVLVGGSSRIPVVSEMLSAEFGRPLALDNHPKHDVALGAAIRDAPAAEPPAASPTPAPIPEQPASPNAATATTPLPVAHGPAWLAADPRAGTTAPPAAAAGGPPAPAGPSPHWRPPEKVGPLHHPAPDDRTGTAARSRRRALAPPALAGTLLMIVAAVSILLWPSKGEPVQREAVSSIGALPPFIPENGDPGLPEVSAPAVVNTAAVTGDTPGLYGGTRSDTCNAQGIRTYLETNPEKAQAWATAVNLPPAQVGPFLTSLTPVSLRTDTAVTNHGFKEGVATPFQSVLQAGTAVLVDPQGLPRVRCYCGNPLGEPNQQTSASYTGASWEGFSGDSVTVIAKSPSEVREFVVVEPDTKQVVNRPQGTSGEKDRAADPAVAEQVTKTLARQSTAGSENSSAPSAPFQYRQGGSNPAQLHATNPDQQTSASNSAAPNSAAPSSAAQGAQQNVVEEPSGTEPSGAKQKDVEEETAGGTGAGRKKETTDDLNEVPDTSSGSDGKKTTDTDTEPRSRPKTGTEAGTGEEPDAATVPGTSPDAEVGTPPSGEG